MIIETAIIAGAAVVISSLGFADSVLKRQAKQDAENDPRNERRRVLERQRAQWIKVAKDASAHYEAAFRQQYLLNAAEIDRELIKLAEEEK